MDQLSQEEVQKILEKSLNNTEVTLISYKIEPFSNPIAGFLGQHFIVTIDYKDNEETKKQTCFLKNLNGALKIIFEIARSLEAYEKEEFFYTYLLKEFENEKIDVSFAPKGYLCKPFLIVLEDMNLKGFRSAPDKVFLDLDHLKVALDTLAKFHSSGVIYERRKSSESEKFSLNAHHPDKFGDKLFTSKISMAKKWMIHSLEGLLDLIKNVIKNQEECKGFTRQLIDIVGKLEDFQEEEKSGCTILHGDLWSNNFLFNYENDKPKSGVLIDYQILKYGSPAEDVMFFLYSNTRKQFRDQHLTSLINYYYESFSDCLKKWNINPQEFLSGSEFLTACENAKILAKIQCLCDRCTTCAPENCLMKMINNNEEMEKYLFDDRAKYITHCFENDDFFRELITEDLFELKEMLLNICSLGNV